MDGFEVIYSKYSPLVFRYLLSLGADFLSAEELTAETFYRAYINFDKYKHRLTRAHREKQLKMSCQALHNAPPNRT